MDAQAAIGGILIAVAGIAVWEIGKLVVKRIGWFTRGWWAVRSAASRAKTAKSLQAWIDQVDNFNANQVKSWRFCFIEVFRALAILMFLIVIGA